MLCAIVLPELYAGLFETHGVENLQQLCGGHLSGGLNILCGKAAIQHFLAGTVVEGVTVSAAPHSRLVEGPRAGLVDKGTVEQGDVGDSEYKGVTFRTHAGGVYVGEVYAQAQRAVVDAHKVVGGEEAGACGVYKFLGVDREKLPLPDIPDGLYLRSSHVGVSATVQGELWQRPP